MTSTLPATLRRGADYLVGSVSGRALPPGPQQLSVVAGCMREAADNIEGLVALIHNSGPEPEPNPPERECPLCHEILGLDAPEAKPYLDYGFVRVPVEAAARPDMVGEGKLNGLATDPPRDDRLRCDSCEAAPATHYSEPHMAYFCDRCMARENPTGERWPEAHPEAPEVDPKLTRRPVATDEWPPPIGPPPAGMTRRWIAGTTDYELVPSEPLYRIVYATDLGHYGWPLPWGLMLHYLRAMGPGAVRSVVRRVERV